MQLWKPVFGYEESYEVSNDGIVRRTCDHDRWKTGHVLHQYIDRKGYKVVYLTKNRNVRHPRVHRLVIEAFVRPMEKGFTVNHKDGNKLNNSLENLEYMTPGENTYHAQHVLEHYKVTAKLTDEQVVEILNMLAQGTECRTVAKLFGVSATAVTAIKNGLTWKWIPRPDMSKSTKRNKLTDQQREEILQLLKDGHRQSAVARQFNVHQSHISRMVREER